MPDQNNIIEKLPQIEKGGTESIKQETEKTKSPEDIFEISKEDESTIPSSNVSNQVIQQDTISQPIQAKDDLNKKIDNILEEGLTELYMQIPKEKQLEFKQKGEETANKITQLLRETKVQVKKILNLIINWLSIIPGINKFFIKQEAKIKTDKLLALKKEKLEKNKK